MKLFSGTSNLPLARKICAEVGQPMNEIVIKRFSDGESFAEIIHSARSQNVVVIQSISNPVNDNLMELLVIIDALKRNGARTITLCAPYLGYSRQDRRVSETRSPISAKLVADMLQVAGVNQLITTDIHNLAIEGFYDIPFMNVSTAGLFVEDIKASAGIPAARLFPDDHAPGGELENLIIVSPDAGGVGRARQVAKRLNLDVAIVDKRREQANQIESMRLIGDVDGRHAILVDDIADTCGTILKCVDLLYDKGAKSVRIYVSHGIFSGNALENISKSRLTEIVVTDSIQNDEADLVEKIRRVSIAPNLSETIRRAVDRQGGD